MHLGYAVRPPRYPPISLMTPRTFPPYNNTITPLLQSQLMERNRPVKMYREMGGGLPDDGRVYSIPRVLYADSYSFWELFFQKHRTPTINVRPILYQQSVTCDMST